MILSLLQKSMPRKIFYKYGDVYKYSKWNRLFSASSKDNIDNNKEISKGFLDREYSIAKKGYNRWLNVPSAFAVQLSIGSVYAWSIFNSPLTKELGVLTSAPDDWTLNVIVPVFSTAAIMLGVATSQLGTWCETQGPRKVGFYAGCLWSSGLVLSSIGCYTHTLPLIYLGYGVFGGMGWGLGYISPVSNLLKWFPDRRGLASGLGLCAFGGGAIIASPLNEFLLKYFFVAPTFVGKAQSLNVITEAGKRYTEIDGNMMEVIVATTNDIAAYPGLLDGVYLVGTGNSGSCFTFLTLGAIYFLSMSLGSLTAKVPPEGWKPDGYVEKSNALTSNSNEYIPVANIYKVPQFYLLWTAVVGNSVAGVTLISCAKTMWTECFASGPINFGHLSSSFVAGLSLGNMFGRLGWASLSDKLGRKNTYLLFSSAIPICLTIPVITAMSTIDPSNPLPVSVFACGTILVVSFYGGVFSVLPAYIADYFGSKNVGAIHGKILPAWSFAALVGPVLMTNLRQSSYNESLANLASKCDPVIFQQTFGAPIESLNDLAMTKIVTINNLLTILPSNTIDPTSTIYTTTLYSMAGIMSAAAIANILIAHPGRKHFVSDVALNKK